MVFSSIIAEELKIEEHRIKAALKLMEEGGTVPFIARYRKDQTDNWTKSNCAIFSTEKSP